MGRGHGGNLKGMRRPMSLSSQRPRTGRGEERERSQEQALDLET